MFYKYKRIFIIVADSVGIGYDKTSHLYGDKGANTLKHIALKNGGLNVPTLNKLGLGDLDDILGTSKVSHPNSFATKCFETSNEI